ncbi:hypothetical protein DFH09DRAFT_1328150 [Mycena vulgaris]|nr:hypothetical protein DFH09DRAFT_1328150 [Mycena vulgaris]
MAGMPHPVISSSRLRDPLNEFVTDSQGALRGILSTKPRSGQYRAIEYDELVLDAMLWHPHLSIVTMWTPAHIGRITEALLDWLLQYLLAADGFLIQSHAINFMFVFHLPHVYGSQSTDFDS